MVMRKRNSATLKKFLSFWEAKRSVDMDDRPGARPEWMGLGQLYWLRRRPLLRWHQRMVKDKVRGCRL
jgi:hypothetical protein